MARSARYKFCYNDSAFTSGLAAVGGYLDTQDFRLNSLYDPDADGVGVQPYGYDNLMGAVGTGLFNYYQVYASKITVYFQKATQEGTPIDVPIKMALVPTLNGAWAANSFDDAMRMPGARANLIRGTDQTDTYKISNYCKTKTLLPFGVDPNSTYAVYNATPTTDLRWRILWDGASSLTADTEVVYDVKITYYAKLWKTSTLNES